MGSPSPTSPSPEPTWPRVLRWSAFLLLGRLLVGQFIAIARGVERSDPPSFLEWARYLREIELPNFLAWGAVLPLLVLIGLRLPLERGFRLRSLLRHVGCMLALVPLLHLLVAVAWQLTHAWVPGYTWGGMVRHLWREDSSAWLGQTFWAGFGYATVMAVIHVAKDRFTLKRRLEEADLLEGRLALADLRTLKMQLNPPFLFDTLRALRGLIDTGPTEAQRMVGLLGELLRRSLRESHLQEVTLLQELELVKVFLRIEQLRSPLEIQVEVEEGTGQALIPHLLLLRLVEGSTRPSPGASPRVRIHPTRLGDRLRIVVETPGPLPLDLVRPGSAPDTPMICTREPGGHRLVLDLPFRQAPCSPEALRPGGTP